jgi:HEPN domain-containing protein
MALSEAEGLLRIEIADLETAEASSDPAIFREGAWGFWLQQSVEKALKAWLVHLGEIPPLTHDLNRLLRLLERHQVKTEGFRALGQLTIYAVQFRYDTDPQPLGLDRMAFQQQVSQLLKDVELALQQMPRG